MKKLILTALAATIVASPLVATAASAAPYDRHEVERTRIVRHEPGRTVIVTRNVRYDRAPVYRGRWHHETRIVYRHGHAYRVTYR